MMDDDELIAVMAGGDDTALRQLFARHAPWLAARLRKALPSDDVEDVLQETFLAVWKNAGAYQPRGTARAWLWVIAGPPADGPRRLHLRRARLRGRPPLHGPRCPHPPGRRRLASPRAKTVDRCVHADVHNGPLCRERWSRGTAD